MIIKIKKALISVSDKNKILEFAKFLEKQNIELISTGGTYDYLQSNNVKVQSIKNYTNFPEILDGRVKTLHPKIHGGLLARHNNKKDELELSENNISHIDLVIVNLYPFAETIIKSKNESEESFENIIENIDIGGPSMLRSAAKNFEYKVVVCDTADYDLIIKQISESGGVDRDLRFYLATKVFNHTASYDSLIAQFLNFKQKDYFPKTLTLSFKKKQELRYGENPHQKASYYQNLIDYHIEKLHLEKLKDNNTNVNIEKSNNNSNLESNILKNDNKKDGIEFTENKNDPNNYLNRHQNFKWEQIQGKELSYNNILDTESAINILINLSTPTVAIVKHNNPCGVASAAEEIYYNKTQVQENLSNNSKSNSILNSIKNSKVNSISSEKLIEIFKRARACDPISAFGGVIAIGGGVANSENLNNPLLVDENLAKEIIQNFVEIVIAESFTENALKVFQTKKNIRLIKITKNNSIIAQNNLNIRVAMGGILIQDKDELDESEYFKTWKCVTNNNTKNSYTSNASDESNKSNQQIFPALCFAWKVCKIIKSNAIVFCSQENNIYSTLGIGAGQMSRLDSVEIAISKSKKAKLNLLNSIVASDAFFPFRDGVEALAKAGAKYIVQPGGSINDEDVIKAANENNLQMYFTNVRHFLH